MERIAKYIFILLLIGSFLPIFQEFTNFFKLEPVRGYYIEVDKPKWKFENYLNGSFTTQMDEYVRTHFGFYPSFVRIDNQIEYWICKNAKATGVVIGKNGFLYEHNYIDSYYGNNFVGEDSIRTLIEKLSIVRKALNEQNKDVWVILCPGKGYLVPENIPDNRRQEHFNTTNYEVYAKMLPEYKIPTLDLQKIFLEIKSKNRTPLFSKHGTHWSEMGEMLAMILTAKFAQEQLKMELPRPYITDTYTSWQPHGRDYDIAYGMNLMFQLEPQPLPYANYEYTKKETGPKKILIIGDSFYFGPYGKKFSNYTLGNGAFWYYNQEEYVLGSEPINLKNIHKKDRWEEHDIVCIYLTDANLVKFGFGWIEEAYEVYTKK